jgi:hypothetical protein
MVQVQWANRLTLKALILERLHPWLQSTAVMEVY